MGDLTGKRTGDLELIDVHQFHSYSPVPLLGANPPSQPAAQPAALPAALPASLGGLVSPSRTASLPLRGHRGHHLVISRNVPSEMPKSFRPAKIRQAEQPQLPVQGSREKKCRPPRGGEAGLEPTTARSLTYAQNRQCDRWCFFSHRPGLEINVQLSGFEYRSCRRLPSHLEDLEETLTSGGSPARGARGARAKAVPTQIRRARAKKEEREA